MEKIMRESKVKCPWCDAVISAEEWNTNTYKECKDREMRRAFKPIYKLSVWGPKSDSFYKCPSCKNWSAGNQLKLIDNNGKRIPGFGGKPVIGDITGGR